MKNNFFGSKLNSILLLVLIVIALLFIKMMYPKQPAVSPEPTPVAVTPTPQAEVSGHKADLVSFSVAPGQNVSGVVNATGSVKNGYFFEGNVRVNILDANKNLLKAGHGTATSDWMTSNAVAFSTTLDFTGLSSGPAFIEIANDNPSGLAANDKSIYIPVVIQ